MPNEGNISSMIVAHSYLTIHHDADSQRQFPSLANTNGSRITATANG